MQEISASTRISEFLNEYPEPTGYLMELGPCRTDVGPESSLGWKLSRAAAEKGLDLLPLLVELNDRIPR